MAKGKLKDHREIGRELELFFFDEISPGSAFWLPKGMIIFKELEKLIRSVIDNRGYQETSTPIIVKSKLFKKSGHWEYFKNNMFNFKVEREEYSIKPMNCPESTVIFASKTRSYKDLPLRLSEFGRLHRNERSGTLNGMFRVRQFVMDDAHVFCRPDQIQSEIAQMLDITLELYQKLQLPVAFGLATRPEKAMGSKESWNKAEQQLADALKSHKIDYKILKGEGTFYGPKIHIDFKDFLNRLWTMATIQIDFQIPQRMGLEYIDKDGKAQRPVMIHRAILGTLERFVGIITEQYQGAFPIWLSPIQVIVLPLSDKFTGYAQKVADDLKLAAIRVEVDERNETLQAKIRNAALQKIPYVLVVGAREKETGTVSVRTRDGKDLGQMNLEKFIEKIKSDIANKS
ncbi:threonine--tRNA ligase [Candidatus Curtissbacteria bacterium RIFCSPLOWO2_02_FULL_40_13b]|uniref:Threonine--tRNA ligase n=3 Tax=Candidatus Curtissiibacteriota TaxID=1752717 RepID=A0A1F5HWG3_9BACT|nr:MAG: threonine--tRNA ligase [Candidatus Curtissbacteria bacterium RIFCSPHIGHO2_01_FULL_40_12]OGE08329.1 MAG: threonine--tRNA ligase [Candidatus Curtissbacteria bacterium RIFCSPLOWO2_02_FULL_40_13b]